MRRNRRKNSGHESTRTPGLSGGGQPLIESLEDRLLLSLLGLASSGYPRVGFDSTGITNYNPATQAFDVTAALLSCRENGSVPPGTVLSPTTVPQAPTSTFALHFRADNSGNLVGGVTGNDFEITGSLDFNNDGVAEYSGVLLTGEILQFGYQDVNSTPGVTTENYDFRLEPTGGSMLALFSGSDIVITMASEGSTYSNSFAVPFTGHAKGVLSPIATLPLSSVAGHVYVDANNNGLIDAGEAPIPNTSVTLSGFDSVGQPVNTTIQTDATGGYLFDNLRPGTYMIAESQPTGYLDGKDTIGTPGGDTANDQFSNVVLASGVHGQDNNFGELLPASIAGNVYLDENDDGIFQPTETGIPGVTVTLTGADDLGASVTLVTTTAGDGSYKFGDLRPGDYTITETQPDSFDDGKDTIGTPGGSTANDVFSDIVLASGVAGQDNNFGELIKVVVLPASIGDYVWLDTNADGIQQTGEPGVGGVTVNLAGTDQNGPITATTQTDASGLYLFAGLLPGTYQVTFVQPAGYAFTLVDQGGDDAADSDADRLTGVTANITLASGQDDLTWDAGLVRPAIDIEKYINTATQSSGAEGFTPGFWKQTQHFYAWTGYRPSDRFNAIFGVNARCNPTLLQALGTGGGGAAALGRHAVAALLNAAHPNVAYAYTVDQVIAIVRNAYATGDFEAAKNLLAAQNELEGDITSGGKGAGTTGPGIDADTAPGLAVSAGDTLTFTYFVSNPGQIALANVTVIDDNATPANPADDFAPTPTLSGGYNIGDENQNGLLDAGETWEYTATAVALAGQHVNTGAVVGTPTDGLGHTIAANVTDADVAYYQAGCLPPPPPPPPPPCPASLAGFVYVDADNDGKFDSGEKAISGVTVNLSGTNDLGQTVDLVATTNSAGAYAFKNLRPGTYAIQETQPAGYLDGKDTLGSLGGTPSNDLFSAISLAAGRNGVNYNFGEQTTPTTGLVHGQTATIGFWHNCNGQSLIKALNGSSCSKALGNWLAANFSNLYGNLAGKTNTQVAAYYQTLFNVTGQKLEAQVMAVALAIYSTNSSLAGGNFAAKYGFIVSSAGTGAAMFNVGGNGAAIGLPNNSYQSVLVILDAADGQASGGSLFKSNSASRSQANALFTSINESGDIV